MTKEICRGGEKRGDEGSDMETNGSTASEFQGRQGRQRSYVDVWLEGDDSMEIQDSQPRPVVEKGSGVQRLVRRLLPLAIKVFQADWIEVRKKNDVEIVDDCEVVFLVVWKDM